MSVSLISNILWIGSQGIVGRISLLNRTHLIFCQYLDRDSSLSHALDQNIPKYSCVLGYVQITSFSFRSVFAPKTGIVFLPCSNYSVFRQKRVSIKWCSHLSSKTHMFDGFFYIGSISSAFKLFRFWCSHYRVAFLFSSVFI